MDSCDDTLAGGLPHSDIHGSTPARGSPWLFAACHVLHRLLVPRHPPNALLSLENIVPGDHRLKAGDKSGVSTMHRNHPQHSPTIPAADRKDDPAHRGSLSLSTQPTSSEHAPCSLEATPLKEQRIRSDTRAGTPRDVPEPDSP